MAAQVYQPLQRYLRRRCSTHDFDKIFNDTLTVLWRRIDDVPAQMVLPWCYGVARRCLANHRRSATRRLRLVRSIEHDADRPAFADTTTTEIDAALHTALRGMSDLNQEVVRLWAWEQLEPREISEVLETTPNAVSVRLNRINRRLESELSRQNQRPSGHTPTKGHLELEP